MSKCSSPLCEVRVQPLRTHATKFGGVCSKCRKGRAANLYEQACDTIPSARTRPEWEAIRDTVAEKIRCVLAQGQSVKALEHIHTTAVEALNAMPLSICPMELARLQRRDTQLTLIEYEARHCIRQPDQGVDIAGRFVLWLQQSSILRGQRF